jgi:uncharacterized protein (UPF0332 family)
MISPSDKNALVFLRIEQAEKCISDSEYCLADERFARASNRVYYGMFYVMLALGLLQDFKSSKHQQMIGWFNKNFVHTGIFPKHFTRLVKDAFDARIESDYVILEPIAIADIEARLADMKLFISTIKAWLEANPAT